MSNAVSSSRTLPAKRSPGRTLGAVVAILMGTLLAPVGMVTSWFANTINDTDTFVATYAPLISHPEVQSYLTERISTAIDEKVNVEGLVDQAIEGINANISRPKAKLALDALRDPIVSGLRSAITSVTAKVVASDGFETAWRESLRASHSEIVKALSGDTRGAVAINQDGIGIRLDPMIARVRDALVADGFGIASYIPDTNRTVTIFPTDSALAIQLGYQATVAAGKWVGLISFGLLALGVLAARNHFKAAIWASVGLALASGLILVAESSLRVVAQLATKMPPDVVLAFYNATFTNLHELALACLTLAVVVGVAAWLAGPFESAEKVRSLAGRFATWLRAKGESYDLSTGKAGEWLYRFRTPIRVVAVLIGFAILALNRPITINLVVVTAIVIAAILAVVGLLQRPIASASEAESSDDITADENPPAEEPQPAVVAADSPAEVSTTRSKKRRSQPPTPPEPDGQE